MKNSKVDLMSSQSEKALNWWNLSLAERERNALLDAFENKRISYNSIGAEFERVICETVGCRYALVTTSGSAALLIALMAAGIKSGDEVIVPNRTFQATANAAVFLGAKVVLADVLPDTGLIDPAEVRRLKTDKTRAVIFVHLNGRGADVDSLTTWAKENNIVLIEDAAQSFYSKHNEKFLGTQADVGCFSFGVTKFLTAGQGGAVVTDDENIYNEAKKFIFHAAVGADDKRFESFGFNFRQSDLLSAIALSQLTYCDQKYECFERVFSRYEKALRYSENARLIKHRVDAGEFPIWIEVLSPQRDDLYNFLKENKIETMKFYPSLHRSPYLGQQGGAFPASEAFEKQGLILPCGPDINPDQIDMVTLQIKEFDRVYGRKQ